MTNGTRLTDIFPAGIIAAFNPAGECVAVESVTDAKSGIVCGSEAKTRAQSQNAPESSTHSPSPPTAPSVV